MREKMYDGGTEKWGEGRRGRYSMRETSMTCTENNITRHKDVKLKLLDTHPCRGKDGLTFSPHHPSCQLFWNPTGTSGRCMGMLEPLGMNNFCNLGGKWDLAAPLHVYTDAAVMFYSDCQLFFVSAASHFSLDHAISCVVNIGKDEACGRRS